MLLPVLGCTMSRHQGCGSRSAGGAVGTAVTLDMNTPWFGDVQSSPLGGGEARHVPVPWELAVPIP